MKAPQSQGSLWVTLDGMDYPASLSAAVAAKALGWRPQASEEVWMRVRVRPDSWGRGRITSALYNGDMELEYVRATRLVSVRGGYFEKSYTLHAHEVLPFVPEDVHG